MLGSRVGRCCTSLGALMISFVGKGAVSNDGGDHEVVRLTPERVNMDRTFGWRLKIVPISSMLLACRTSDIGSEFFAGVDPLTSPWVDPVQKHVIIEVLDDEPEMDCQSPRVDFELHRARRRLLKRPEEPPRFECLRPRFFDRNVIYAVFPRGYDRHERSVKLLGLISRTYNPHLLTPLTPPVAQFLQSFTYYFDQNQKILHVHMPHNGRDYALSGVTLGLKNLFYDALANHLPQLVELAGEPPA